MHGHGFEPQDVFTLTHHTCTCTRPTINMHNVSPTHPTVHAQGLPPTEYNVMYMQKPHTLQIHSQDPSPYMYTTTHTCTYTSPTHTTRTCPITYMHKPHSAYMNTHKPHPITYCSLPSCSAGVFGINLVTKMPLSSLTWGLSFPPAILTPRLPLSA